MAAFRSAVEIGAHGIETDLHLSKDGVVVLSHDATLKRCFGEDTKVADCDWSYLSTLRTTREPRQPMPRLVDLLEYMAQPEVEHIWVLLDIKRDDDASELISRTAATIASVPSKRPWNERIMMGCWQATYMKLCMKLMPGFPLTHIGWSLSYARQLLEVPNMNFNLLANSLLGPWGTRFVADAHAAGRSVLVWTVNDDDWMRWSIRKGVDGVITDDPQRYLEICRAWPDGPSPSASASSSSSGLRLRKRARSLGFHVFFQLAAWLLALVSLVREGTPRRRVREAFRD